MILGYLATNPSHMPLIARMLSPPVPVGEVLACEECLLLGVPGQVWWLCLSQDHCIGGGIEKKEEINTCLGLSSFRKTKVRGKQILKKVSVAENKETFFTINPVKSSS